MSERAYGRLLDKYERLEAEVERLKAENADLRAKIKRLTKLLKAAAYHVEGEGDVSLLHDIRETLGQEPKP